ncbi:Bicyclomycin resistance protein [Leucobacter soli]|uniref:Bicyclomycin resistance protein n=2 Tax=Leucobacter soli TaxID=2812850 RepID=A0A916JWV3_9MICO|nr:multidrug effflux MFS transporter [Leucobacter soli]CAG7607039.1 Bicyclomycin resistance protein [Leucobacter soli]
MPTAQPRLTAGLLAALGLLAATSALATDLYLSSIPSIAADLQTSPSRVQLTLSLFFFGLGAGQLVLGPLSDSLGRRPVLIAGTAVFTTASVATVFSPTIEVLIALRLVQGISGAAGIVLARAIAADLSRGENAVKALSLIAMVVGVAPLVAPPVGSLAHELWGWRGVLAALAVIAASMLLTAWRGVPESLPREKRLSRGLRSTLRPFGGLLRDRVFVLLLLAYALGFTAMISYVSASPFVGQQVLGMSPVAYAFAFTAGATAFIATNLVNARLGPRVGPARMLAIGSVVLLVGALGMLAFVITGTLTIASFIACAFALGCGTALTMSNSSTLALMRAGHARGSGSALLGTAQFALGGTAAPLVGLWGEGTALPMAVIIAAAAVLSGIFNLLARR